MCLYEKFDRTSSEFNCVSQKGYRGGDIRRIGLQKQQQALHENIRHITSLYIGFLHSFSMAAVDIAIIPGPLEV